MNTRITELITAAEKHIEERDYSAALEHLVAAEQIEPENKSIRMIKDLVRSLKADTTRPSRLQKFIAVAVDRKPPPGINSDSGTTMDDVHKRVRSLVSSAEYFLLRGSIDTAFEWLMRAYLLDPVAPEVLSCEQRVLPAWQRLHGKSATQAKREWKFNLAGRESRTPSSLFDRLKSGKLFA